ncbi:TetR/AcrR family transcriptional regulator [Luteipulveratus mongoliensis]|uniref:HTH tetR-type domain-containing protein n=1 Tax=Luteipulveratus mongoliensis TaxID=571913 RepID=A0A0K1JFW8_9MICO|nr:TetR/AcrR family transcriptional regulator [Luteipulveratus mongoliensis]AKU15490.1 hypothetical protein VV02_05770 [Luteipulveratus mongoliensis]
MPSRRTPGRDAITLDRIVDTALALVRTEGYEAVSMRRVATALDTGPASLYAHVANKRDLDQEMLGRLVRDLPVPAPDPDRWREQVIELSRQMRDLYVGHPGLARAVFAVVPTHPDLVRMSEGMLAIMLAGRLSPQSAAWGIDLLALYITGYCYEQSLWVAQYADAKDSLDDLRERFEALPAEDFPLTHQHLDELMSGEEGDRFDYGIACILQGISTVTPQVTTRLA